MRAGLAQTPEARSPWVRSASGLEYQVTALGQGRAVQPGHTVTIHEARSLADGRVMFASRVAPNNPVTLTLGAHYVIPGAKAGVTGMRVGARRRLRVPPSLDRRTLDRAFIPPDATGLYDIELLTARP
jgi:FKBP-type peptidyl-prolyl cis-trans isomerase